MATQKEIEATYDYMDEIFRLSLGSHADITCAMYNGNFSLTLEEAQKAKHEYILSGIHFKKGDRVLDIGCGWGPMLEAIRDRGGYGIGSTLSPAQAEACCVDGFDASVQDWKDLDPKQIGRIDGVVAVGVLDHACSTEELLKGKQEEVYDHFFKLCSDVLEKGGRLFVQTMMWGKRVPHYPEDTDVHAPKLSDSWVIGHLTKFYPGSWPPNNLEQIEKCARPYFRLISENNGRLDYIQTMNEWGKKLAKFSLKKIFLGLKLSPRYIFDKDFRYQVTSFRYGCNRLCFERELMSHQRLVFEKI